MHRDIVLRLVVAKEIILSGNDHAKEDDGEGKQRYAGQSYGAEAAQLAFVSFSLGMYSKLGVPSYPKVRIPFRMVLYRHTLYQMRAFSRHVGGIDVKSRFPIHAGEPTAPLL